MTTQPLILIIDDEEAIVAGLCFRLRNAGYRTIGCYDGREGLEAARENEPRLILLDKCLPELDGGSVLAELRADANLREIPVVLLSGAGIDQRDAIEAGAAAFLRKPYRKDELLDLVESLLAQSCSTEGTESWVVRRLF